MKKLLLSLTLILCFCISGFAETIVINGTEYNANTLIQRDLGPGVVYKRLRIPEFPLNVNMLFMDMTNPYARIETQQGQENIGKTESLATASKRLTVPGHKVLGGANGNFWCVTSQNPWADLLVGATFNGNVKNGVVITETNNKNDKWNGGWKHTGVIAVDVDKNVHVGHFSYYSTVTSERIGTQEIFQVNKVCRTDELAMYNKYYGTDKSFQPVHQEGSHFIIDEGVSTEVLLSIEPGQEMHGSSDVIATVKEVRLNAGRGTLGEYDMALVGKGTYKDVLAQLQVGDKVTYKYDWYTKANGGGTPLKVDNLIGGNAMVLIDGEYTTFNDSESYNSRIYSRTGYATDDSGKKMAIIVIDKSSDPVYGNSAGCNTKVMCDILKHFGYTQIVNMDAGGSAQMLVDGKIINKTTEGTPRAVANGFLLVSVAPEDNTVARLEFDAVNLEAPIYSSYEPVVLAYNKYGDLIDQDFKDFTLSCDANIGTCDGRRFTAAGNAGKGNLTASYNGVSVSKEMTVSQAELAIRIKPILIDATKKYPIEVTAELGGVIYNYDPADIEWTIGDETVATIDANGVLAGVANGTTTLTGKIGDFSDQTEVKVEIAGAPKLSMDQWSDWKLTATSGLTSAVLSEDGNISFNYGSSRSPTIKVSKKTGKYTFYSIPDKIVFEFTPTVEIEKILFTITPREERTSISKDVLPAEGVFAAGKTHKVEIEMTADMNDLINYPLNVNTFTLYINKATATQGAQSIRVNDFYAEYSNYLGVENVVAGDADGYNSLVVSPNPVAAGSTVNVSCNGVISSVEIYSISGQKVAEAAVESTAASINAPANSGLYVVRAVTSAGSKVAKLIVE